MKASENPFRSSKLVRIRYALPQEIVNKLAEQALGQSCSCLLGPKGTGKTTLLEDLDAQLQAHGYKTHWIRLTLESPREAHAKALKQVKQLGKQDVCLFDGAEVLSFVNWHRLCSLANRNQMTLIVTLHRKRAVPILHRTQADWPLAEQFVRQLSGKNYNQQLRAQALQAFQRNDGNMREVFRACYLALAKVNEANPPQALK